MQNEMVEFQGLNSSISKKSMCITLGTIPKTKKKVSDEMKDRALTIYVDAIVIAKNELL